MALRYNINSTDELSVSFNKAYQETLSKHHSFLVRPVFSLAMSACPTRASFYEKLGEGDVEKCKIQIDAWVQGLEDKLKLVVAYYVKENLA